MKANDPKFYVYVYFRLNGSPCYVGKGCGQRWLNHEQKNRCSNHRLRALIERAGGELPKLKIREGLSNEEASAIEIALIAAIGRGRKGPLVNMTDGGEGTAGNVLSLETREKIASRQRGSKWSDERRARASATHMGRKHSEEVKQKISEARRGKIASEEARAKMSVTRLGRKLSPEHAAKVALNFKREKSPEHKAKLRANLIAMNKARAGSKRPHSAETRAKIAAANTGKTLSAETRAKIAASRLGQKHSSETRAKMVISHAARIK